MKTKEKITGRKVVRARLIEGTLYNVLADGSLGRERKGRVNRRMLESPAASQPDRDTPRLTLRELKQFRRVNPNPRNRDRAQDVAALRRALNLSQAAFAEIFQLSVATVRDWESRRRRPEGPARVLLRVIAREPEAVRRALEKF